VVLSNRYITDRFLPDKAIDLIDEAASRLRIEIDSMPTEIDELERQRIKLEIEQEALKKEKDKTSKERLEDVQRKLADLGDQLNAMKAQWTLERDTIQRIRKIKEDIEKAQVESQQAERTGNLSRVAEIRYGTIVSLEQQMEKENERLHGIQQHHQMLKEEVSSEDVAAVVAKWTSIPVDKLLEGEKEKLLKAEQVLKTRVIGQNQAVTAVANAVRRARAGLQDPDRPLGSFIFLGPTGVGKTELTKALATFLFDTDDAMVRVDMSEFMEKHSVARLIGAPPGYVGYEEGGYLTEAVRRKPYSVILLDEVEKAHPDVFNILLQVLDDGRLTDGHGRTVDFRNTVVVMTSNLGSQVIQEMAGEANYDAMKAAVMEIVGQHFRPEFINRVDDVVVFHPLAREQIRRIATIQIAGLSRRLHDREMDIVLTDAALDSLGAAGFDPVYGARPLKRAIQQQLENPLAQQILAGKYGPGDLIQVDVSAGTLVFSKGEVGQVSAA
jgi:ATP-dependent Clp protease ATP-binding subunit ClpB